MDFEKYWTKALKSTEILRTRVAQLNSHSDTHVPYVLLSESTINQGDTVVRKGEVLVQKPTLILPPDNPQFDGFEFSESSSEQNNLINFLLVRGVSLPSMRYNNTTVSLDVYEDKLSNAVEHYLDELQSAENMTTGLMVGPEDCWQFSLLIFICSQITKNAQTDIKRLLDEYHRKKDK